ncbi:hypothetical protein [Cupriavidus sp. BIS7]|uniref:class I fructose-bisphosphate aldolase n=1 Tax=Cupriavidus sp. BIS7 TaxID=1217718 RepID=UPI0003157C99|nr:hypothetical protein [Cupriavidus sp. BIS7]
MADTARMRRWSRFVDRSSGLALIVPMDHGLTVGPIRGIDRIETVTRWLSPDLVTGVVLHKGLAERLGPAIHCGMMVHLNGALALDDAPDRKLLLTSVDAAIRLGADAVSVQTNFTPGTAAHNLRLIGDVVEQAHQYGLPVMAMVYDRTAGRPDEAIARMRHFMRAAVELGVDVLKIGAPDDADSLGELLDGIHKHVPVVMAGGALMPDEALLNLTRAIARCGGAGLCVGRNVFQRDDPSAMLRKLGEALRGGRASHSPVSAPGAAFTRNLSA